MRDQQVMGRFAPSPSGRMHLGNAFSCLLAWLSARAAGGGMVLRLEDLDPDRCKEEYCRQVEKDLRWMGLDWDRGGMEDRPDYRQSNCRALYEEAFHRLEEKGLLYPCFCSRGELHAASAPHRSDGVLLYSGKCRNLTAEQRLERAKRKRPAIRIRVPDETVTFQDGHLGEYRENLQQDCGDFILRRSDGVYAYQLAVVVDDARMGVNQVVRGGDLLDSTPRQLWLQTQLGLPSPEYYHLPLLLAPDGRRLSKRERDLDFGALRAELKPEELIGLLAWLAGQIPKAEPISPRELISEFSWDKVPKEDIIWNGSLG